MSEVYAFELTPEQCSPSGLVNCSGANSNWQYSNPFLNRYAHPKRDKNKFYFDAFFNDYVEYKRKYQNDWSELSEYVGLNDIELTDNELTIVVNKTGLIKQPDPKRIYMIMNTGELVYLD